MKKTDREAKVTIFKRWPCHAHTWAGDLRRWVRAQPKPSSAGTVTYPQIVRGGPKDRAIRPDLMYAQLNEKLEWADLIIGEHSNSFQNFTEKRALHRVSVGGAKLAITEQWLNTTLKVRKAQVTVREYAQLDTNITKALCELAQMRSRPILIPIRFFAVTYFLNDDSFEELREHGAIEPHEFFVRVSAMGSYDAQTFKPLLTRQTRNSHFHGKQRLPRP